MIPDIPWILQRFLLLFVDQGEGAIALRAYAVIQSAPAFCLLFCTALAVLMQNPLRVWSVLYAQCLIHLLLDACEQKGGVGVPFFAPLSWHTWHWPVMAMDGPVVSTLSLAGVLVFVFLILQKRRSFGELGFHPRSWNLTLTLLLLALYALLPLALIPKAIEANLHDLKTWSQPEHRAGAMVHLDRVPYQPGQPGTLKNALMQTSVQVPEIRHPHRALISGTARFTTRDTLVFEGSPILHPTSQRFNYNLAGLLILAFIWLIPLFPSSKKSSCQDDPHSDAHSSEPRHPQSRGLG
jgi:hypothetical protein